MLCSKRATIVHRRVTFKPHALGFATMRSAIMDISQACKTLRDCNDRFCLRQEPSIASFEAIVAVGELKSYLEGVRADGKPIRELAIAEHLLFTPEGMRWIMPFVISAEGMLAHQRRMQPH